MSAPELKAGRSLYISVGAVAGAVIALQIDIMRIFSTGSWAHFGSLVVSLAMLGFGLTSAIMCVSKSSFDKHWRSFAAVSLLSFGPLSIACNLAAQQTPFNAIFLISDPLQKWRLAVNFVLYLLPFLAAAFFLGTVFLRARTIFSRVYFADLTGSGLGGLAILVVMFWIAPDDLILVPLAIAGIGAVFWFVAMRQWMMIPLVVALTCGAGLAHRIAPAVLGLTTLAVSDYKGVAYARKFPDAQKVLEIASPFGFIEVYSSSYLHFAPGLSDNAAFNLPEMSANAYLGLYVDGEGPSGIIRDLPAEQKRYFRYLPMYYPFLIKQDADAFVVQFGGGISTSVALASGARSVIVAESNPAVLSAFRTNKAIRDFTGDILADKRVRVIDYDGRLFLAHTEERFDIIDLSLADSAGLSSPGGFAIVEKFAYSRESFSSYMRALKDGGVLSVTLWNKEEPPKSVLKLYATMAQAARDAGDADIADRFFVSATYLSAATVLYKRGGFTADEIVKLREHTSALSFDEIYYPGAEFDTSSGQQTLDEYRAQIFGSGTESDAPASVTETEIATDGGAPDAPANVLPPTTLGRLAWRHLVAGTWEQLASTYVFDARPLTNDRPYFSAYIKPPDLLKVLDRLELVQDEWGYLVIWATLAVATIAASLLILLPLIFGWRTIFSAYPGKFGTIVYFACLGLGYIMVEVGLISSFVQALSNATVSASILITGMLVFSGLGSFVSERYLDRCRTMMPFVFTGIAALLAFYGLMLDRILDSVGGLPYAALLAICFALVCPPAFLMGFPMPTAMTTLGRLRKDHMFLWAWGINGCFSVTGAALVPIVSTIFGLSAVLLTSAAAYLLAAPAFFAVLKPRKPSTSSLEA